MSDPVLMQAYQLADRLHLRVADVFEMTEAEFRGWPIYLRLRREAEEG